MGMDFNTMVFPSPDLDSTTIRYFNRDMIVIPRISPKYNDTYIPCLLYTYNTNEEISKNLIIFFHGNAEDMFSSSLMAKQLRNYLKMNILIVEYPGYSLYTELGKDSEILLEDTIIIYDYLRNKFKLNPKNIFIYGRSIGTSPAAYLASRRECQGLFLVSSFTSIRAVAKNMVGFLSGLLKDRFMTKEYITNVKCPVMFIHGQKDPLIPFQETQELVNIFKEKSDKFNFHYPLFMTHNDYDMEKDILGPIKNFTEKFTEVEPNIMKKEEGAEEKIKSFKEIGIDDYMKENVKIYLSKVKY